MYIYSTVSIALYVANYSLSFFLSVSCVGNNPQLYLPSGK